MMTYPCINQEEVHAKLSGFLLHVLREAHIVTPVSTIILLFDVSFEPAVGISGVQKVNLTPFQWSFWTGRCILCVWLHAANIPRKDYIILQGAIATVIAFACDYRCHQGRNGDERKVPHVRDKRCGWLRAAEGLSAVLYPGTPPSSVLKPSEVEAGT